MKDRVFQQIGSPQEIYQRPANRAVATFVGSPAMNFLPGRIVQDGGRLMFETDTLRLSLASYPFARKPEHAMPVELGIRPEHIVLSAEGAHDVAVEKTEPMGSELLAWTRLDQRPLSIRLPAETKLNTGDRLRVLLPEQQLNLFDINSGVRV